MIELLQGLSIPPGALVILIAVVAALWLLFAPSEKEEALDKKIQLLKSISDIKTKKSKRDELLTKSGGGFYQSWHRKIDTRLRNAGSDIKCTNFFIILGVIGLMIFVALLSFSTVPPFFLAVFSIAATVGVGNSILLYMEMKMREEFIVRFPSALDMISRGVRAGLPIANQIQAVGDDIPGVVGRVFRQVTAGTNMGLSLSQSLRNVNASLGITEFNFFTIAVATQQQTGASLYQTLENLSVMGRKRLEMRDKIKAQSSGAKGSAYVVGGLPLFVPFIMSLLNPDYYEGFFDAPLESPLLLTAGGLYLAGIASIKFILRERF